MRSIFPGHFRPTQDEFAALWAGCLFVIDANVLLNLYRYSPETRRELERALGSVKNRLFIPHQAAKEFLKNRLTVIAGHADEYTKAIRTITDLTSILSNKKKHPFLPDADLSKFTEQVEKLVVKLEAQRTALLDRLTNNDEILEFVYSLSGNRTGVAFDEASLSAIALEGDKRYQNEIPPGYKDGKKDSSGDPYRKFGDLILWKQLISKAKSESRSVIFVTDDKKEDWWLEQSGRTIGPRTELREEFLSEVGQNFWMYTVDKFIEETARTSKTEVSEKVFEEIIEVRQEATENRMNRLADRAKYGTAYGSENKINRMAALASAGISLSDLDQANRIAELAKYSSISDEQMKRMATLASAGISPSDLDQANRIAELAKYSSIADEQMKLMATLASAGISPSALDQVNRMAELANRDFMGSTKAN